MLIQFDLGDWSNDGHGRSMACLADSSHSAQAIADAYHKACQETGFVLHERVCAEYEDNAIDAEALATVTLLGWRPGQNFKPDWVTADDVFAMFVVMVRRGNPAITLVPFEPETFFQSGTPDRSFQLGYGTLS